MAGTLKVPTAYVRSFWALIKVTIGANSGGKLSITALLERNNSWPDTVLRWALRFSLLVFKKGSELSFRYENDEIELE